MSESSAEGNGPDKNTTDLKKKRVLKVSLQNLIYGICGAIALLSLVTIIVMTALYLKLKFTKTPHHDYMKDLRNTLAVAYKRPGFRRMSAQRVADEIENMPTAINLAHADYDKRKKEYHSYFQKTTRSSPASWMLHGKSLYYFSKGEKTWPDAESFCASRDAHLASVLNDKEQDFITSQIKRASWIGLTDENKTGIWGWADGSRLQKQYWSAGEPNNTRHVGEPSCTLIVPSSTNRNWNDANCHKLYGWVCKNSKP